jgi:hypothetical protein
MSAEYGVNIDYTSLGRIHFKIELMADSHEQALKSRSKQYRSFLALRNGPGGGS